VAREPSRARARRCAAVAALAGAVVCCGASGQDEGPLIVGEQEKLVPFGLLDFRLALELLGRYQTDKLDPTTGSSVRESETRFRQTLELGADAFAGHPDLLDLDLDFRLRFEQDKIDSDVEDTTVRTYDTTIDYDVAGTFLRRGKAPVTLYSLRNQTLVDRQFGSTLDSVLFEYGGRVAFLSEVVPTRLQIFRREQDQSGRGTGSDFEVDQNTVAANGQIRPAEGHVLTWNYTYDNVEQSGTGFVANDFDRHLGFATYDYSFGPQRRDHFRASLELDDVSGEFGFNRFRADSTLRLQHTRDLDSRYDYTFDRRDSDGVVQSSHNGKAQVRHKVFDSLITIADVGLSRLDIDDDDDFKSDQVFGSLRMDYTNRVPYGRFDAKTSLRYSHQDDSDRGTPIQITDEPHVFGIDGIIVLNRRNIVASSIVVTDATGIITYVVGADYTVQTFADRTELRRVLGGAIGVNQPLLIDYQIGPEPGGTTKTRGLGVTLRYSINQGPLRGLSFYSNYFDQNEDRSSDGAFELQENDIRDLRYGVEYDFWHLSLTAERQDRRSSLSPFEATRLEGRWLQRFGPGSSLMLSALYQDIDRTDEDTTSKLLTFSGRWNQQLTRQLRLGLTFTYRDERDSPGADTRGFDQVLDLTWSHRQTEIFATFRNALVDSDADDTSSQSFLLGLRREF
jgi:hypothetical protein